MERGISARLLVEHFGEGPPPVVVRAPGRVNLIGEHTDYNGGCVLPFAIDRVTEVALRPREDEKIRVFAERTDAECTLALPASQFRPTGGWEDYLKGILAFLSQRGRLEHGFDGAVAGDVPLGAGLSSSASLEIAMAIGVSRVYKIELPDLELVKGCQWAENEFVGTSCGIMDQYASFFGRAGTAILLDTSSLSHRYIPLRLHGISLIIIDSRVRRTLATSGYNTRRKECEQALILVQKALPDRKIASLSALTEDDLERVASILPPPLLARARHVIGENARVLAAVEALERDDHRALGALLFSSHASLRDLFQVSTPELDFLVDWGREHGALGARLVGGGFGGVTLHLVPDEIKADYIAGIVDAYRARFAVDPEVIEVRPGPGAKELNRDLR